MTTQLDRAESNPSTSSSLNFRGYSILSNLDLRGKIFVNRASVVLPAAVQLVVCLTWPGRTSEGVFENIEDFVESFHLCVFNFYHESTFRFGSNHIEHDLLKTRSAIFGNKYEDWLFQNGSRYLPVKHLHQRFQSRTAPSCHQTCPMKDPGCSATTLEHWIALQTSNKLKGIPLFSKAEFVFPWEEEYLSDPSLQDIKTIADKNKSRVYFISKRKLVSNEQNITCVEGDKIRFRVDLVDSYGKQRKIGGDEVRTWISGKSYKTKQNHTASGYVQDLGNGSYIATVTPVWTGSVKLHIALVYPREYIRAFLHHGRVGADWFVAGIFINGGVNETTLCQALPNIPGRPCLCNYTETNGVPFYCGKPLDKRLSCDHLSTTRSGIIIKSFTAAEHLMEDRMARPAEETLVPHGFTITSVEDRSSPKRVLTPCISTDRNTTWTMRSPRGIWTNNKNWTSLLCLEGSLTKDWAAKCLQGSHIWILGDSVARQFRKVVLELVNCSDRWLSCYNKDKDIRVTFKNQASPIYSHNMADIPGPDLSHIFDQIPSTGSHVILYHVYLHEVSGHLSRLLLRLIRLRDSIASLIDRNPRVLIGLRGPHIITVDRKSHHIHGGDVGGRFVIKMYHEVFKDLRQHIVYLEGWDMTTAIANKVLHPIEDVSAAMVQTLLSFKCL